MPLILNGTSGVTFNDSTTQGTAFSSAGVLNALAAASAGAVGTYVMATLNSTVAFGGTVAGSSLRAGGAMRSLTGQGGMYAYSDANQEATGLSGTWRCMGRGGGAAANGFSGQFTTLWLRIS